MGVLAILLLAAAFAPHLSAAQPVVANVIDEGAEAVSDAIQHAIAEQDGQTAAQLIAQAIAAQEKPDLGQVIEPQQKTPTPVVLPAESIADGSSASGPADEMDYPYEEDGAEKFAQGVCVRVPAAHDHAYGLHVQGAVQPAISMRESRRRVLIEQSGPSCMLFGGCMAYDNQAHSLHQSSALAMRAAAAAAVAATAACDVQAPLLTVSHTRCMLKRLICCLYCCCSLC
jgi:hypothetical protein